MPNSPHRKGLFYLRLTPDEKQRLYRIVNDRGHAGCNHFVMAMVAKCEAERLPESQGGVRKIIPEAHALAALEACNLVAGIVMHTAHAVYQETGDRELMRRINRQAERQHEASGYFAAVLDDIRYRRHVLSSGLRQPRHRTRDERGHQSPTADVIPDQSRNSP